MDIKKQFSNGFETVFYFLNIFVHAVLDKRPGRAGDKQKSRL